MYWQIITFFIIHNNLIPISLKESEGDTQPGQASPGEQVKVVSGTVEAEKRPEIDCGDEKIPKDQNCGDEKSVPSVTEMNLTASVSKSREIVKDEEWHTQLVIKHEDDGMIGPEMTLKASNMK